MRIKEQKLTVTRGHSLPLGAVVSEKGVNFSLYSKNAFSVTLLIFNKPDDLQPSHEFKMDAGINQTFHFWHIFIEGLEPGCGYAYRVNGSTDRSKGHRFNPNKVLIDPYARGISFKRWNRGNACHEEDNVETSLRGVVVDTSNYDWEGDMPLRRPMEESIIYEMHVAGFTKSPTSGVKHPGTFLGLIEKIPYLKDLGITAVELLPIFDFDDTQSLGEVDGVKLSNYWGYSTVGFFSPHHGYCVSKDSATQLNEFRDMVKAFHKAGIEVILDVVFNHTDEGNQDGPVFSFKGIDNSTYYYLTGENGSKNFYYDYTGCGNTVNCNHPIGEKFILDCLRFWVKEMHVDGFRFDEGSVLTRGEDGAPMEHPPLIWAIELEELLSESKVIAEAWDAAGLYQIGYFPGDRWAEWNGKYRDTMRRFVKGETGMLSQLASRMTGSADLYQWRQHQPTNSINFITAHDGFTMHDLVSYNEKHNWANGESNHDGANDNDSWNCGSEGETTEQAILELRNRQMKNLTTLLMLSMGVPMFVAGDEYGRTQMGNNNTYCQDNALNWIDWDKIKENAGLIRFWSSLIKKRQLYLHHFKGNYLSNKTNKYGLNEIEWHGTQLNQPEWGNPEARCLALTLGDVEEGEDNSRNIFIMMNMHWDATEFQVPAYAGLQWQRSIDTALPSPKDIDISRKKEKIEDTYVVTARSIVVLVSELSPSKTTSKS
ncbi:MAG: glycogen debranching protein GlgX [Opitutaceae bacterium]|nr:glycogen debranching protein GlgX [Cytophagales bacterium]